MITKLRLKNFRRYEDQSFDFSEGVTFVVGHNNAGKTSIFYAIEYSLFGNVTEFKTIASMLRPKTDGGGVEIEFIGNDSKKYRLQRIHLRPPNSRTKTVGHFTLKEIEIIDGGETRERYILSSDFQDREEQLALKIFELLGLSKRLFQMAIYTRQSEAARVLSGDDKLDIVLGITAVGLAAEEFRALALDFEKQADSIGLVDQSLNHQRSELERLNQRLSSLAEENANFDTRREALQTTSKQLAKIRDHVRDLLTGSNQLGSILNRIEAQQALLTKAQTELSQFESSCGDLSKAEEQIGVWNAQVQSHQDERKAIQKSIDEFRAKLREKDQAVGDLQGRIARREKLPKGTNATCETCGQPIDHQKNAKEIASWQADLNSTMTERLELTQSLTALEKQSEDAISLSRELESKSNKLRAQVAKHRELQNQVSNHQESFHRLESTLDEAALIAQNPLGVLEGVLTDSDNKKLFEDEGNEVPELPTERSRDSTAEFAGRLSDFCARLQKAVLVVDAQAKADLASLNEMRKRVESEDAEAGERRLRLDREIARLESDRSGLESKRQHSKTLRLSSKAFQELQQVLRQRVATTLAAKTLEIHRKLASGDEFKSLSIDPKDYSVHVCAHDYDVEVPAAVFQGGGHRVLLGLAFKMALVNMVGHCPFLLLDEPTDGLDQSNRQRLLEKLSAVNVARQMLVITHDAQGETNGHVLRVERGAASPPKKRSRKTKKDDVESQA